MGIGIGGGLGPFRMGVSTRGFGMGVGPLHASTGWGRSRRGRNGEGGAFFAGALLLFFAVMWPYLLGTWLAVQVGAANPSTERTVTGWVFEVVWVVLLAGAGVAYLLEGRRDRAARELAYRQSVERDRITALDVLQGYSGRLAEPPAARPLPTGTVGRKGEYLLDELRDVALLQPRVPTRGQAPVPTEVDEGRVLVTSHRVLFLGSHKTINWNLAQITSAAPSAYARRLLLSTSSRQTVNGLALSSGADFVKLRLAVAWALAHASADLSQYSVALTQVTHELTEAVAA